MALSKPGKPVDTASVVDEFPNVGEYFEDQNLFPFAITGDSLTCLSASCRKGNVGKWIYKNYSSYRSLSGTLRHHTSIHHPDIQPPLVYESTRIFLGYEGSWYWMSGTTFGEWFDTPEADKEDIIVGTLINWEWKEMLKNSRQVNFLKRVRCYMIGLATMMGDCGYMNDHIWDLLDIYFHSPSIGVHVSLLFTEWMLLQDAAVNHLCTSALRMFLLKTIQLSDGGALPRWWILFSTDCVFESEENNQPQLALSYARALRKLLDDGNMELTTFYIHFEELMQTLQVYPHADTREEGLKLCNDYVSKAKAQRVVREFADNGQGSSSGVGGQID